MMTSQIACNSRRVGRSVNGYNTTARDMQYTERYYMRRIKQILQETTTTERPSPPTHPVQLTEHIFIGNQRNADDCQLLLTMGITHVLSCANTRRNTRHDIPYNLAETGVRGFLLVPAEDREDFNIERFFNATSRFLNNVQLEDGRVLVHCTMGVNRSAAIIAAYLMGELGWKLLATVKYLKAKRLHVLSNKGFRLQLVNFARQQGCLDPIELLSTSDTGGTVSDSDMNMHETTHINKQRSRSLNGRVREPSAAGVQHRHMTDNTENLESTRSTLAKEKSEQSTDTLSLTSSKEQAVKPHLEQSPEQIHLSSYIHYVHKHCQLPNDVTVTSVHKLTTANDCSNTMCGGYLVRIQRKTKQL